MTASNSATAATAPAGRRLTVDERRLRALIAAAVAEALCNATPSCTCRIPAEAAAEMGHLMGMVRDLGQGDTARGVESMRDALRFVPRLMRLRDRIGTWVLSILVAGATGGVLTLVWHGLTSRLGGGK